MMIQKVECLNLILLKTNFDWACSSVVERYVDIVEVISSILITPTIAKTLIVLGIYILPKR